MSVVGETTAVVSLGMSCQAADQIKKHADWLSALLGERMRPSRLPFDWVLASPATVERLLDGGFHFPASPDELDLLPLPRNDALRWRRQDAFFYVHDFRIDRQLRVAEAFATTRSLYAHAFSKFAALGALQRRVFVICNSQNDLADTAPRLQLDLMLTADALAAIQRRLDALFPRGRNELMVITYAARAKSPEAWPVRPHIVAPDATRWEGDGAAWSAAFAAHFAARPPAFG